MLEHFYYRCQHDYVSDTECSTNQSKINEECNCKSYCVIEASNAVFGDPCLNTYKYVNVTYMCVPKKGKVVVH